jgi:hypothetical protein
MKLVYTRAERVDVAREIVDAMRSAAQQHPQEPQGDWADAQRWLSQDTDDETLQQARLKWCKQV